MAAIVAGNFLSISIADAGVQNDAFKADKQANAANNKMRAIAYTTGTNSAESQKAYIAANIAGAKRALAFAQLNGTPRIDHTPLTQTIKGTAYVAPEKLARLTAKSEYANKHTGTPQYVVKNDTAKSVYYGETHRPNTSSTVNYADKHTGTPQYVVKNDTAKSVYYGETHRPNTSTTPVAIKNVNSVPHKAPNNPKSDSALDKQLNGKQLILLNSTTGMAQYNAQQIDIDNQNIAENRHRSTANNAAIRANSQRLDSIEQHQSAQDLHIDENKKQASAGISAAFAQANIPQVTENQQFAVGAGVGGYDSENAIAVGASFHATSNSVVKLTVSDDSQDNVGYGAGVSVGW
ncbi:YadA C-terminal domain-containing protein [Hafnia alvei]|uniref:YadA C-terminal domain-containing protein n=1 Tax=Hafnia alvei TaxID=569 RepID=UPI001F254F1B|nr:YadA-like family protein [Hafnia alvei]